MSTLNSSESECEDDDQKKVKSKYTQKYRKQWESPRNWLKLQNNQAFCKLCQKALDNNVSNLNRHSSSEVHKKKEKQFKGQTSLHNIIEKKNADAAIKDTQLRSEIVMVMYCVSNHLPFTIMDSLPQLFKKLHPSGISVRCGATKANQIVSLIAQYSHKMLCDELMSRKFSLIIDESTDVSVKKCLVLIVRFLSSDNVITDRFLGLFELDEFTATKISDSIKSYFKENNIPSENLIGLATDNASVMRGDLGGVRVQLKTLNQHLFYLGCTCHSLHLCAASASKEIPSNIENLVRRIYGFFSHSSKRQTDFKNFQQYFQLEDHKLLNLCSTRWLSILDSVVRVIEQWTALKHYFMLLSFEEKKDVNVVNISDELNDENKAYLLFLSYILAQICKMNKTFQSERPMIHMLSPLIKHFFINTLGNFVKSEFLCLETDFSKRDFHLPIISMFFGLEFEKHCLITNLTAESKLEIKSNLLKYYIKLCTEVKKRFDFADVKINLLEYLDPKKIHKGDIPSILPILQAFPFNVTSEETLNAQWRALIMFDANILNEKYDKDVTKFCLNLMKQDNILEKKCFKELSEYMLTLLTLPHSSAAAERQFSEMNIVKCKIRNRLKIKTVENLMFCKSLLCTNQKIFEPSLDLLKYFKKFKLVDGKYQAL